MPLSAEEVRVVGALIEKQMTTPEYYPLTLNSLLNACNQSSNRNPVVSYDESTVQRALDRLRDEEGLVRIVHSVHNRAAKWRQVIDERLALEPEELALLGVLLLRGPQTLGELKGRTERLHPFADLGEVESALDRLAGREPPLVTRVERQPGQKEARFSHLLAGSLEVDPAPDRRVDTTSGPSLADRVTSLEAEVAALRDELTALRTILE
jgi:uncharacterized protein YceH (UPF0502 family)